MMHWKKTLTNKIPSKKSYTSAHETINKAIRMYLNSFIKQLHIYGLHSAAFYLYKNSHGDDVNQIRKRDLELGFGCSKILILKNNKTDKTTCQQCQKSDYRDIPLF